MTNIKRPAWESGYIAYGLPNALHDFVVVDYNNHPFSFSDDYIYSEGISKEEYHSFIAVYMSK